MSGQVVRLKKTKVAVVVVVVVVVVIVVVVQVVAVVAAAAVIVVPCTGVVILSHLIHVSVQMCQFRKAVVVGRLQSLTMSVGHRYVCILGNFFSYFVATLLAQSRYVTVTGLETQAHPQFLIVPS